jgi:hypothetical protein
MPHDPAALDTPLAALATFDWGGDASRLAPLDAAVVAAHGDAALRADLEKRFAALLAGAAPDAAKDYACRQLARIGTAAAVPAVAPLLADGRRSHMARFALEGIGGPEAGAALRQALATVGDDLKLGMISSLGARPEPASVAALAPLLAGPPRLAAAAAAALGLIRSPEAERALAAARPADAVTARSIDDARLACAEALVAGNRAAAALPIYESLAAAAAGKPERRGVELAATRGILACRDARPAAS